MRQDWDFSEVFEKKLNDFEAKKQERLNKQKAFNQQISDYQSQIDELTKKIAEVEEQNAYLDLTEPLLAQGVVDQDILKGIAHGEKALEIKEMIGQLHEKKGLLDRKIGHEKTLFEYFKSRFPA